MKTWEDAEIEVMDIAMTAGGVDNNTLPDSEIYFDKEVNKWKEYLGTKKSAE